MNLKNILVSERKLPDGGCGRDRGARSHVMIEKKKRIQLEREQNGRGAGILLLIDQCSRHPTISSFSSSSRQEISSFFHRKIQSYMKLETSCLDPTFPQLLQFLIVSS
jgi:hypothetical protein